MDPIFILDNGAHTIKAGWAHEDFQATIIPNGIFRSKRDNKTYIADQLDDCDDFGGLKYRLPFEKGILTNWDIEKPVWDRVFNHPAYNIDPSSSSLLVTEQPFNLPNVALQYDQMIFEEYEFASYTRCSGANFVPFGSLPASDQDVDGPYDSGALPQCVLVVDLGYSATHIVPVHQGVVQWSAVVRIDVGGKMLTNFLKEVISYRQWNVMEDTHVINTVKEACCYVSMNVNDDQTLCKYHPRESNIVQNFVLPDFSPGSRNISGYIQSSGVATSLLMHKSPEKRQKDGMLTAVAPTLGEDQVLKMANERFTIPELLFQPSGVGLSQQGLPEAISTSIARLPQDLQGLFWANVTLVGGSCQFPNLVERLRSELRALAPTDYFVGVRKSGHPVSHIFDCIRHHLSLEELPYPRSDSIRSAFVTRAEYQEHGSNITRRRFWTAPMDPAWQPPKLALREGDDVGFDSEGTVSSGHSEELRRKKARWAAGEQGFGARGRKKRKDKDESGFRMSGIAKR